VRLTSYPGTLRQLVITGLGHDAPTVIITNHHDLKTKAIVERYARRMTIEQRLAEIIGAFCTDALSSAVNLNVDLDVMLAVLAQALLAALRARLPGYHAATPDTLQRRFLETPGTIINHGDTITVRLERRAYAPSYATPTSPPRPPSPAGTTQGPGKSPFAPNGRTCLSLKSGSRPGPMRSRGAGPRRGAIGQTGTNRDFAGACAVNDERGS